MIIDITLITTGGTIDGADSETGTLQQSSDAAKWLNRQPTIRCVHLPLFNKDSRLITDDDRKTIIEAVYSSASTYFLVTHGTYTICQTGRALKLAGEQCNLAKKVLLVGSWIPFEAINSDAPMQMKFAIQSLHDGQAGVFVAMDGRLWDPNTTDKVEVSPGEYRLSTVRDGPET